MSPASEHILSNLSPDPIDDRDYIFTSTYPSLPRKVDLREYAGGIENQGKTGSCVANATVSALELLLERKNRKFDLSRLFLYYNLRALYPELHGQDKGCFLKDGFKSVSNRGICSEKTWEFNEALINTKPSQESFTEALQHVVQRYERIPGYTLVTSTKVALAKGFPVTIAAALGRTFHNVIGDLRLHNYVGVKDDLIGHHAMNIVGYDDDLGGFIVENSWGTGWGDKGYFLFEYNVIVKDCIDVWVCTAFDGIVFEDTWHDESPDIVFKNPHVILTNYLEEGRNFNGHLEIVSGTEPLTYSWTKFNLFGNAGTFALGTDPSRIEYELHPGMYTGAVVCKVEGSGPLKKVAKGYITFKYLTTPNPNPPEPPKPPEPEPPEPEPEPPKPRPRKKWYEKGIFRLFYELYLKWKD